MSSRSFDTQYQISFISDIKLHQDVKRIVATDAGDAAFAITARNMIIKIRGIYPIFSILNYIATKLHFSPFSPLSQFLPKLYKSYRYGKRPLMSS